MIKEVDFQELNDSTVPLAVVKFYSKNCGPCKLFRGTFEKLAEANSGIEFWQHDVNAYLDSNGSSLAKKFAKIEKIPAVAVLEYGEVTKVLEGRLSRDAVQNMIN